MYDKEFLNSWKEVAQYVGRSKRTIQRWEREFGFPVHRPAGKIRSSVMAVAGEIDEWIRKSPQAEYREYVLVDVAKSLLPVLDSLERALGHKEEAKDFSSGLQLIYRQLQDALNKIGVEQIATEGDQFNPAWHEAVEAEESDLQKNRVLDDLQRGYTFKGRLLRPAMVRVSRQK